MNRDSHSDVKGKALSSLIVKPINDFFIDITLFVREDGMPKHKINTCVFT